VQVGPFLRGTVLEVGAGLGTRTRQLAGRACTWVAIEPDRTMGRQLAEAWTKGELPGNVEVVQGSLTAVSEQRAADAVLYLDVLEHVADDGKELSRAAARLRAGGHLVVLSPAHPWLYTPFDRAIGHHRRYTRDSLAAVGPAGWPIVRQRLLDSAGLLASAANRLVLHSAMPTRRQVLFWDRVLVRTSRLLDPLLAYRAGKSVLTVWRKPD